MEVRPARAAEAEKLARLHQTEIPEGFLSRLGIGFLTLFYRGLIELPEAICLTAVDNGQPVGLITGATDVGLFYRRWRQRYRLRVVLLAPPLLLKPGLLKGLLESREYAHGAGRDNLPKAELISLAVIPSCRGTGLAAALFSALLDEFAALNVSEYKVGAGATLERANAFYRKMGLRFACRLQIHEGAVANIYTGLTRPARTLDAEEPR